MRSARNRSIQGSWAGSVLPLGIIAVVGLCWGFGIGKPAIASLDARSEYLAIVGGSGRGEEEVMWLFDTRTEELIAVAWDRQAGMMMPLGRRSVSEDLQTAQGGR